MSYSWRVADYGRQWQQRRSLILSGCLNSGRARYDSLAAENTIFGDFGHTFFKRSPHDLQTISIRSPYDQSFEWIVEDLVTVGIVRTW